MTLNEDMTEDRRMDNVGRISRRSTLLRSRVTIFNWLLLQDLENLDGSKSEKEERKMKGRIFWILDYANSIFIRQGRRILKDVRERVLGAFGTQ